MHILSIPKEKWRISYKMSICYWLVRYTSRTFLARTMDREYKETISFLKTSNIILYSFWNTKNIVIIKMCQVIPMHLCSSRLPSDFFLGHNAITLSKCKHVSASLHSMSYKHAPKIERTKARRRLHSHIRPGTTTRMFPLLLQRTE